MKQKLSNIFGNARDLAEFIMLEVQIGARRDSALERVTLEFED